jgi:hypothetical protein
MATRPELVKQDASRNLLKLEDDQISLLDALYNGTPNRVATNIRRVRNPNFVNNDGATPLIIALRKIHWWQNVVHNLVEKGATFDAKEVIEKDSYFGPHYVQLYYDAMGTKPPEPPKQSVLSKLTTSPAAEKAKAVATGLLSGMFKPKAGGRRRKTRRVSRK